MPVSPLGFALLLLAAAGRSLPVRPSSDGSLSEVVQKWKEYQLQCQKYLYETPPIVAEGKFCNRTFDDYACWPDGLPGTYVNVSCPWYLPWANAAVHFTAGDVDNGSVAVAEPSSDQRDISYHGIFLTTGFCAWK